jgi:hypothetical protein
VFDRIGKQLFDRKFHAPAEVAAKTRILACSGNAIQQSA